MNSRKIILASVLLAATIPATANAQFEVVSRTSELVFDGTNFGQTDALVSTTSLTAGFNHVMSDSLSHVVPGGFLNTGTYTLVQNDVIQPDALGVQHEGSCVLTTTEGVPVMVQNSRFDVEFIVTAETTVVLNGHLSASGDPADNPHTLATLSVPSQVGTPELISTGLEDLPAITTLSPGETYQLTIVADSLCNGSQTALAHDLDVLLTVAADLDGDGAADLVDNCLTLPNADQRDTDGDGFGNLCDADLDNNCATDFSDLALLKAVFFGTDADADIDGSGTVDFLDLGLMKNMFFAAPGPSGVATCN